MKYQIKIPLLEPRTSTIFIATFFCFVFYSPTVSGQQQMLILNRGDYTIISTPHDAPGALMTQESDGVINSFDLVCNKATNTLMWPDGLNHQIVRGDIFAPVIQSSSVAQVSFVVDLDIDEVHQKLYWVDNLEGRIYRSDLDGSNQEIVPTDSLTNPSALAVNGALDLLFYTDLTQARIWSSRLDGTNRTIIVQDHIYSVSRLLIDPFGGKLYWASDGDHNIEKVNFDGTGREIFYQGSDSEHPYGLYLATDEGNLYWTDYGEDKIMRATLNGSSPAEEYLNGLDDPVALLFRDDSEFNTPGNNSRLALYPNPANQKVTFASLNSSQSIDRIRVFDPFGKELFSKNIAAVVFEHDVSTYSYGYYTYSVQIAGKLFFGRFAIIR